jgi:ABC-type Fe3+/spermidine/putrescine transport system ATPase subunit
MSNLDAQLREQVRMELRVLHERLGFTAIYVTHDQSEAFALAEQIVVMNRGKIDTVGPPRDVFNNPRTPFVARFLGLNVVDATVMALGSPPGMPAAREAGGYAQVRLGETGPVLWGRIGAAPVREGERVLACIRKEHVGIHSGAPAPSAGAAVSFAGAIQAASFLGLVEEYIVMASGIELRAIQTAAGVQSGDRVTVAIEPDHCIVLPAGAENVAGM